MMQYVTYTLQWKPNPHPPVNTGKDEGFAPHAIAEAVGATWEAGACCHANGRMLGYIVSGSAAAVVTHPDASSFAMAVEADPLSWARAACESMGVSPDVTAGYYLDTDGRVAGYPEPD